MTTSIIRYLSSATMDNATPPNPSTPLPPKSLDSAQGTPTARSPPTKTKAMQIKEEENEASILESIDTGYDSDAPVVLPPDTQLELKREKERYPGASTWAPDEEHLFEILFQRAERPLLPRHWEVDFRGIPMLDTIFCMTDDARPIVYSRSGKDFQATMALLRLIDLTSSVRKTVQSGLRHKAPSLIKKSLDKYLAWAAEDGGYSHLRYVPNMITAELDATLAESEITSTMERCMRGLALLQREFLRVDRDKDFWGEEGDTPAMLVDRYVRKSEQDAHGEDKDSDDEVVYRRKPPVVYGLFILRSSVFLLTVDSAKGGDAYVSFHVDVDFMDRQQSVWNALTIAIAVCLARDQLTRRMEDFEESPELLGDDNDG